MGQRRMRAFVVLAFLGVASHASAECRLTAEIQEVPIEVEVPGRDPIAVRFRGEQEIVLLPSSRDEGIRFRTHGPVELVARFPRDHAVIVAVHTPTLRAGPILLHDGALLRVDAVGDTGLFGFVRIAAGLTARVGPLSCVGLHVLTSAELTDSGGFPSDDALTHVDARLDGPRVRLEWSGVAVMVHTREPLEVARLERRGDQLRVRRDYPSAISIDGWASQADVTATERRALEPEAHSPELTLRGGSSWACGGRQRAVRVRDGVIAVIRDGPQGAPWATIREGTRLQAEPRLDGYVLYEVPSAKRDCNLPERAWLSAADVEEFEAP